MWGFFEAMSGNLSLVCQNKVSGVDGGRIAADVTEVHFRHAVGPERETKHVEASSVLLENT